MSPRSALRVYIQCTTKHLQRTTSEIVVSRLGLMLLLMWSSVLCGRNNQLFHFVYETVSENVRGDTPIGRGNYSVTHPPKCM